MSATTPPKREVKRSGIAHHATQPHGIILIGGFIFLLAWAIWTFFLSTPVAVR